MLIGGGLLLLEDLGTAGVGALVAADLAVNFGIGDEFGRVCLRV